MRDPWTPSSALGYLLTTADLTSVATADVDQVLTECLDFQGDEMPICSGFWKSGDTSVEWQIQPIPRDVLVWTIKCSRIIINRDIVEQNEAQYDALLMLRRLYQSEDADLAPEVLQDRREYNAWLDKELAREGVKREDFWAVEFDHDLPLPQFAGQNVHEIVDKFKGAVALEDELIRGMRPREEPSSASGTGGDDRPEAPQP